MRVKDRLLIYIESKNLSNRAFELKCGLSNGYVKGLDDSIRPKTLGLIAEQFKELNINWLLTGEGEMLKENILKEKNLTLQGENISLQSLVDIIKLQQESIKMFNETTLAQQKTIQLQISKNETQQKSLELIQESLKVILDLQSKITFQQTRISTSVRKEENVECADAG